MLPYHEDLADVGLEHLQLVELDSQVVLADVVGTDVPAAEHQLRKAVLHFISDHFLAGPAAEPQEVFLGALVVAQLVVYHHAGYHVQQQEGVFL